MRYVLREEDVAPYAPANHNETRNRRIISRETVGAKFMEIVVGTIQPGATAAAHAHPGIEQAVHVLEGTADVEIDGRLNHIRAGDWVFMPDGAFHDLTVTSDTPLRLIVIYSPPYSENRDAVILKD